MIQGTKGQEWNACVLIPDLGDRNNMTPEGRPVEEVAILANILAKMSCTACPSGRIPNVVRIAGVRSTEQFVVSELIRKWG